MEIFAVNPWTEFFSLFRHVVTSPGFGWSMYIFFMYSFLVLLASFVACVRESLGYTGPWTWRRIHAVFLGGPPMWVVFAVCIGVFVWLEV